MHKPFAALALSLALASSASAQTGIMLDIHQSAAEVQKKFADLAQAIPESAFAWRPGAGVRSVGEVLLHVASDNYLIPIGMGKPAPASSGITSDYKTAAAFEKRTLTKAQILAERDAFFKHVHQGFDLTTEANLGEKIKFFGQEWTRSKAALLTVTHLHEHLGQLIAYARSNGVTPPWSR